MNKDVLAAFLAIKINVHCKLLFYLNLLFLLFLTKGTSTLWAAYSRNNVCAAGVSRLNG